MKLLPTKRLRHQLNEDHARLETLFQGVLRCLRLDDREETARAWREFSFTFHNHMDAEERFILPGYRLVAPSEAKVILEEHALFRRELQVMAIEVELHVMRTVNAHDFIERMRSHGQRETQGMDRWAEGRLGKHEEELLHTLFPD